MKLVINLEDSTGKAHCSRCNKLIAKGTQSLYVRGYQVQRTLCSDCLLVFALTADIRAAIYLRIGELIVKHIVDEYDEPPEFFESIMTPSEKIPLEDLVEHIIKMYRECE
jgi:hypothetical protein